MCEEGKTAEPTEKKCQWTRDNDIIQNLFGSMVEPLKQLRNGLVEERKRLMRQRNDWKRENLDG